MRRPILFLGILAVLFPFLKTASAQTATLREVHTEGLKTLTEPQVIALAGLTLGSQVGRKELQDAADNLVRSGLFANVNYKFDTHNEDVKLTFTLAENSLLTVSYDNFPWYADSELDEAIRKELPFYNSRLPEAGEVVERAAAALKAFVSSRDAHVEVTHQVVVSPLSEGSAQQFSVEGPIARIASVEFSDPSLAQNLAVRTHLSEVVGHTYSRMTVDIFLSEQIRPIYLQQGLLRAKIGPAEVRLPNNPNQKLTEQIPVFVPCTPGHIYRWEGVEWKGNSALSTFTLAGAMRLSTGDIANGLAIEGGFDRVREEYGHLGFLEVKLTPTPKYNDTAHTISYEVPVVDGVQYHYGSMTISGMSLAGERMIREAWPQKAGDIFDKTLFEDFLARLESKRATIFKDLPIHYDTVGHFLQTDPAKATVEVLLDFK